MVLGCAERESAAGRGVRRAQRPTGSIDVRVIVWDSRESYLGLVSTVSPIFGRDIERVSGKKPRGLRAFELSIVFESETRVSNHSVSKFNARIPSIASCRWGQVARVDGALDALALQRVDALVASSAHSTTGRDLGFSLVFESVVLGKRSRVCWKAT